MFSMSGGNKDGENYSNLPFFPPDLDYGMPLRGPFACIIRTRKNHQYLLCSYYVTNTLRSTFVHSDIHSTNISFFIEV